MALLGPLDPSQSQERQRAAVTAQSQHWEDELNKMLREGAVRQNQGFTSPTQVAGQWAQALRSRMGANQAAQNYASLGAAAAPGEDTGSAFAAPPAPDTGPPPGGSEESVAAPPAAGGTSQAPAPAEAPAAAPAAAKHGGKPFSPEIKQAILEGSQAAGVDPQMMAEFAHIESDGDPTAHKRGSQYKGLMQLNEREMAEISKGQGNVWNPKDSVMAAATIARRNAAAFEKFTGRQADKFDLYMMHQQGPAGYLQHIGNPNAPAVQNMLSTEEGRAKGPGWAHQAIVDNQGHANDTSAQFIGRWKAKFDRMAQGDFSAFRGGQQTAQASGATPGGPAPTGAPGAAAGAPGQYGVEEIPLTPQMLAGIPHRPAPQYSLPQLQQLYAQGAFGPHGMFTPQQGQEFFQQIQQAGQPIEIPYAGGTLRIAPGAKTGTYIPTIQNKPVKIGDIEIQQPYWINSKGQFGGVVPSGGATPGAVPGTAPGGAAGGTPGSAPGGAGPAPGSDEDLSAAIASGDINRISKAAIARDAAKTAAVEGAKVAPDIEKKAGETRAEAQEKSFEAARTGFTGMGTNFSLQAPNLRTLTKLAPLAYTGTGADTMLALNRFADKINLTERKAAPRELFEQLATRVLADQFSALRNYAEQEGNPAGKVFKSMLDVEEKSNISANDSLPGVLAKLKRMQNVAEKGMHWADLADEYVVKNKHLDPKFMTMLRKEIANTDYDEGIDFEEPRKPGAGKPGNPPEEGSSKEIGGKKYHFRGGKWYDE